MKKILFVFTLAMPFAAFAQIYKCEIAGKINYQSTPCAGGNQKTIQSTSSSNAEARCFKVYLRPKGLLEFREYHLILKTAGNKATLEVIPPSNLPEPEEHHQLRVATASERQSIAAPEIKVDEGFIFEPTGAFKYEKMAGIYRSGDAYVGFIRDRPDRLRKTDCIR